MAMERRMVSETQGQDRVWARQRSWLVVGFVAIVGVACTPGGTTDQSKLPPNVQDPATLQTPSGAVARYHGALTVLPEAFDWFLTASGILTDELAALPTPLGVGGNYTGIDSRHDLSGFEGDYNRLHRLRAQAREARGFLTAYAPDSSPALRGHLFAVEGYADLFLADLFCSGIPLSTVDFNGDYTLAAGSSTTEVYTQALAFFDSALTLLGDSAQLQPLAAVGRGRVLLALGRYADAETAVTGVADEYRYQVLFDPPLGQINVGGFDVSVAQRLLAQSFVTYSQLPATPAVADREGTTGLDYRVGDPRVVVDTLGPDVQGHDMYFPAKYPTSGLVTLTLADGVEARLIEAEAALQAGTGEWLVRLNALRTDGTFEEQPTADPDDDPAATDTLWHAGRGGVPGLAPLADPGSADAQADLLFRERAFWLYLTGHRQGDLRRLIRQYHRQSDTVYPTGFYSGGDGTYRTEIVAPVPTTEQDLNPKYTGCINRGA